MGKFTTDRKITLGFTLAFAALTLVPLSVQRNKARLIESNKQVLHSHEVLNALEGTLRHLVSAEGAKRGYTISGSERELAQYQTSIVQARSELARFAALTINDEVQQQRVKRLEPVMDSLEAALKQTIQSRRPKPSGVSNDSIAPATQMELARSVLDKMCREEQRMLEERSGALHNSMSEGMNSFWAVASLNFLILGVSFVIVNYYVAHRRAAEQRLQQAKQAAEQANVAKSNFLANMSHEIRTPMTAILGYADNLLEPDQTSSDRLDCLQTIRRNARHLLELINNVLDISKIEAGKMIAEQIVTDLPQIAAEVSSMMRPRALEKGLQFQLLFEGGIPQRIKTDPLRLKQVLVNLVGNAIKFTEKGKVQLCVSCEVHKPKQPHEENTSTIRFDVVDTGIGLTQQQTERLFQPFSQADSSMSRRFGGTGLGLTISKRLAALMGGEIAVRSTPLVGTVFSVTIAGGPVDEAALLRGLNEAIHPHNPNSTRAKRDELEPGPSAKLSARVLLVEDGIDNQRLISSYLRKSGAEVAVAENGLLALEMVQARPFDLILMDMQMPEMDGYSATGELRRRGITLPIIALTAHAMSDDRAKCIAAGCSDYMSKPISRHKLIETIRGHLQPAAEVVPPEAAKLPEVSAPVVQATAQRSTLRSDFAGDTEMREVLSGFVNGLPAQVNQLEKLLAENDITSLRRAVHQIKGSGGGYGFMPLTEVAARAEQRISETESVEAATAQVRDLIDLIKTVEGYRPQAAQAGVLV